MNKIIDETLNLPPMDEVEDDLPVEEEMEATDLVETPQNAVTTLDNDKHDIESDEIREKAIQAFDDIMELGQNVEPSRSARMFEVAGQFLKTGLDASNSKMDMKLKAAKLKLEARKLKMDDDTLGSINHGAEVIADRNALLKTLIAESDKTTIDVEPTDDNSEE